MKVRRMLDSAAIAGMKMYLTCGLLLILIAALPLLFYLLMAISMFF